MFSLDMVDLTEEFLFALENNLLPIVINYITPAKGLPKGYGIMLTFPHSNSMNGLLCVRQDMGCRGLFGNPLSGSGLKWAGVETTWQNGDILIHPTATVVVEPPL